MSASSLAESFAPRWSLATRIAFRFIFSFLFLFYFPFPLTLVPFIGEIVQNGWNAIAVATGKVVFGLAVNTTPSGSGDQTVDWICLFVIAVVSGAATLIWSIAGKAASYPRLHRWFHVYLRMALATAMIGYGAYKVIPSQFIAPSLDRLLQPFGDASPMGLLWTFMGASAAYTIFTGLGEITGGLLLTNRRTALLGALITAAVMTHVVVLNFTYDVPVKNYSALLLLTALFIAAPDAKRLLDFFVIQRPAEPLFARRRLRIAARWATALFVLLITGMELTSSWKQRQRLLAARLSASPLHGVWNVDELTVDGVAHAPLTTDLTRWRRFVVSGKEWGTMQTMDDGRTRFVMALDEKKQTLTLKKRTDPKFQATLHYRRPDAKTLLLDGPFEGKTIAATLRKGDEQTFLLTSRGFHWINEVPFNR